MKMCPTCGRRPSERHTSPAMAYRDRAWNFNSCENPLHDLADSAPERLEKLEKEAESFHMRYRTKCDVETKALHVKVEQLEAQLAEAQKALADATNFALRPARLDEQEAAGDAVAAWRAYHLVKTSNEKLTTDLAEARACLREAIADRNDMPRFLRALGEA